MGDVFETVNWPEPSLDLALCRSLPLPPSTVWAVACHAEFRLFGPGDLLGVLHRDAERLRFTTTRDVERFVGDPREFAWEVTDRRLLRISHLSMTCWFTNLRSLDLAAPIGDEHSGGGAMADLVAWLTNPASETRASRAAAPQLRHR